jgi:hypothetical protein
MTFRLVKIDDSTLQDHYYLTPQDNCYYFGEYTARAGHAFSDTNQLIMNFKKSVETRGTSQWRHKEMAIRTVAELIAASVVPTEVANRTVTFVPIPPSKSVADPLYDDRMTRVLQTFVGANPGGGDVRELLTQVVSTEAYHLRTDRPSVDSLRTNYRIVETYSHPVPNEIILVDDVLTTGCHFKAASAVLNQRFPNVPITGLFVARRVINRDVF